MSRRTIQFVIFFSIALSLYTILNSYIFIRGWEVVPPEHHRSYAILFVLTAYAFFLGRLLERFTLSWFSSALVWIGSFWLAAMVHLYLILVGIDILRLVNYIIPFFPQFLTKDPEQTKHIAAIVVCSFVAIVVLAGHVNAVYPRVRTLNLTIPKNSHQLTSLNVVAVSDIHLGTVIGRSRLSKIVAKINALNPDLVLLPGDVFDEDIGPVIKKNLGDMLRSIRSNYGVISVTGNHEYIGGVEEACSYLTDHGILVLRDAVTKIADSLYIVGREDLSINRFAGKKRKTLEELLADVDRRYPVILMDHQPFRLDEAVQNGIDLQLSGHTHNGQIWPFSYITRKVFELSWGYEKKENTHFYVSCGVGTWGPPVRTGNRPEIVNIKLQFN